MFVLNVHDIYTYMCVCILKVYYIFFHIYIYDVARHGMPPDIIYWNLMNMSFLSGVYELSYDVHLTIADALW